MLVRDLIKELEKLPQDASMGVWNDDYYEIQDIIITKVTGEETYLSTHNKENFDYFVDTIY